MTASKSEELISYLTQTRTLLKTLKVAADYKSKTTKYLCARVTLDVFLMRIEGAICAAKTGSGPDLMCGEVVIQKKIYDPVVDYWSKELVQ